MLVLYDYCTVYLIIIIDENVVKPVITPTNTQVSKSPGHSQHVQTLLDMGFDLTAVEQALDLCQQNIERAIHLLTTGELLEESEIDESCKNEEATCPKFVVSLT